jgi:transposase
MMTVIVASWRLVTGTSRRAIARTFGVIMATIIAIVIITRSWLAMVLMVVVTDVA